MSSLFARRMDYVKKFSNLNIFLISPRFLVKIADNCRDKALEQDPRWTQQRYESSLEIKLLFFLSISHGDLNGCGGCLFMHAWVAFSLIFF